MKKFAILIAVMAMGSTALAQGKGEELNQKWYVGPLVGIQLGGNDSEVVFGADFGTRFNESWGAGLYGTYVGSSAPSGSGAVDSSFTTIAAEGNYFFDGSMTGLRAGAKAGLEFSSYSTPALTLPAGGTITATPSNTAFVLGPHIAYDYGLGGGLSVGAEANVLFVTQTGRDALTNLLASFKFWF